MGGFSEIEEAQADFKACLAKLLVLYAGETVARSCTAPCGAKSSGEEEDPKAWGLFSRRRDAAAAAFAGKCRKKACPCKAAAFYIRLRMEL